MSSDYGTRINSEHTENVIRDPYMSETLTYVCRKADHSFEERAFLSWAKDANCPPLRPDRFPKSPDDETRAANRMQMIQDRELVARLVASCDGFRAFITRTVDRAVTAALAQQTQPRKQRNDDKPNETKES